MGRWWVAPTTNHGLVQAPQSQAEKVSQKQVLLHMMADALSHCPRA